MNRIHQLAMTIHTNEEGHTLPAIASLIGGAGAVLLGVGAANDSGALAIAGGIIAGVGIVAASTLEHTKVDWDLYSRLDKMEKK